MQEQVSLNNSQLLGLLKTEAVELLKKLISTPSFSKEEDKTAALIDEYFLSKNISTNRSKNNIWLTNKYFDENKKTILLNSHHDTVKPDKGYTLDPFSPLIKDGKLFGLGSNDAGGCLVSLIASFLYYYETPDLKYNLVLAASAEEEISGTNGIECLLPEIGKIEFGIVGEPTKMNMAIAEKGLLVLDCVSKGKAGHAARDEGENAIYKALQDIEWFKNYRFEKVSDLLGPIKMSVTSIETENKAHNVVPASCNYVVDIRVNELYTFEEIISTIKKNITSDIQPRSLRMRPSGISMERPIVKSGLKLNRTYYGSPTTSDKALMNFPALKIGPGDSARSHTADEFIFLNEIEEGIELYINLLKNVLIHEN